MYKLIILFFLLSVQVATAQKILKGKIVIAGSAQPVASASVFINNTSIGTIANEQGEFVLEKIPTNKFDLIVSCMSYETNVQSIDINTVSAFLLIELKPKPVELHEVVIGGHNSEGWKKWGDFFIDNFIGTSSFAKETKIVNADSVHFWFNKKENALHVYANTPLIIENKALGYIIKYQLELFKYSFNDQSVLYFGYPLFQDMIFEKKAQLIKCEKNRTEAYNGSLLHFIRSLYQNKLQEEGFEVRRLIKVADTEREKLREMNKTSMKKNVDGSFVSDKYIAEDASNQEAINFLSKNVLTGDSIRYANDSTHVMFAFIDYLDITFKKSTKPSIEYMYQTLSKINNTNYAHTQITFLKKKYIEVFNNGYHSDPSRSLFYLGFWAWSEKIANILPFDYLPPAKKVK